VAISWLNLQSAKRRSEAFREQAEAMGLQFDPKGGDVKERFGEFKLMSTGRRRFAKNLISGDAGDVRISIFDYQYNEERIDSLTHSNTGSSQTNSQKPRIRFQTVVALESANIQVPDFSMRRQHALFDKLGKFLGGQDIDFDDFPEFSKMFVLQGPDEEAIRRFFTPSLIGFFEKKVGHSVAGKQGKMILYKTRKYATPEEIKDLLAAAYEVYGHIADIK